ncbi:MAG: methyltransferase [Actinomycetota bacterium]
MASISKKRARAAIGRSVPPAAVAEFATRLRNGLERSHTGMAPPFVVVLERLFGLIDNRLLAIAVDLEIPDRLHETKMTIAELAAATGADADSLERMMRYLVSRGIFRHVPDDRYANNAVSDCIRKDHPWSWRDWVRFFGSDWNMRIWTQARHSVMTGESAAVAATGHDFFNYVNEEDPAAGDVFNGAMTSGSRVQGLLVQEAYDFRNVTHVCDVGGGAGAILADLLEVNPHLKGTLFELPAVAEAAKEHLGARGLLDRCTIAPGDFFVSVPAGCDLYTLFAVVHDWGDEDAHRILANIRKASGQSGKVLVIEGVLPQDDRYSFTKSSDMLMLVLAGAGKERYQHEFESLFSRAGFRLTKTIKLPSLFRIFELTPVES